jgi:tRNA nucleotidyltransferase (CCA-adding enzyme)
MVNEGEVDSLVLERVWVEVKKALIETQDYMLESTHLPALRGPSRFFQVLKECGALERLFPELNALFGVPQPVLHHPEIDTGIHTLLALDAAVHLSSDPEVRFAVLLHDLGKGATPEQAWPSHHGHETEGVPLVEAVCKRFKVPVAYRELAKDVAAYHLHAHRALDLKPKSVVKLFKALDAFRRPERLEKFLLACRADAIGRAGHQDRHYPEADFLRAAFAAASVISAKEFIERGVVGPQIGREMHSQRVQAVRRVKVGKGGVCGAPSDQ